MATQLRLVITDEREFRHMLIMTRAIELLKEYKKARKGVGEPRAIERAYWLDITAESAAQNFGGRSAIIVVKKCFRGQAASHVDALR